MKKYLTRLLDVMLAFVLLTLFFGCTKNNDGPKELYAYISPNFQPGTAYEFEMKIIQTPVSKLKASNTIQKLPPLVHLTRPLSSDVTVHFSIEGDVLDQYNLKNETNYQLPPDDAYRISNKSGNIINSIIINAGNTSSSDSIYLTILKPNVFVDSNNYVIPLKLKSADKGIKVSNKVGTLLILPHTEVIVTNINGDADVPSNAMAIDRTNPCWTIMDISNQSYGLGRDMLDGNYSTSWMGRVGQDGLSVTIDMGANHDLKGIQISPNYLYSVVYNAFNIELLLSKDNNHWISQGNYYTQSWGGSPSNPDIRNIIFYEPVNSRYMRII